MNLTECNNKLCNAHIDMRTFIPFKPSNDDAQCGGKGKKSIIVRITTYYSDYGSCDLKHNIFYTCMYNGCNNETTSSNLVNITQTSYDVCKIVYGENIISTITDINYFTVQSTMSIQPFDSVKTTTETKEITSTTVLNRSFTTSIGNTATQDFQALSMLINISFSLLFICFLLINA